MKWRSDSKPALYPNYYTWLVFIAAMDIMMTTVVIVLGGYEANGVARAILVQFGVPGMACFKLGIIAFVIFLCEIVGRRNFSAGRLLAGISIGLNCVPVALAFGLLAWKLRG